ncbi:hypothetical protein HY030_03860 [Candidatus Gottesmanbacteria bacterium]|nr:hypothetical protein [Candidatus Gottesmanbacteria bacterium]
MKKSLKLEEKIIKKVYHYEEKRLVFMLFRYAALVIGFLVLFLLNLQIFFLILKQQQTLDLFDLFSQDLEIIKNYLGDVLLTFYEELPKTEFVFVVIFLLFLFLILLFFVKKLPKIKNRLTSILRFHKRK